MDGFLKPIVYTKKKSDEDISKKFIEYVVELTHKIYKDYYQKPEPLILTKEEEKEFKSATICHICEEEFSIDKKTNEIIAILLENIVVRLIINVIFHVVKPLIHPVIFHNLQGYDAHLFIKKLAKVKGDLTSIPTTEEK